MSRIGKKPISIPAGVSATIENGVVKAKGPKGELSFTVTDLVLAKLSNDEITLDVSEKSKKARSLWGLSRTMIANIIHGVSDGFEKKLTISGVGYRAAVQGNKLQLALGFSHDVNYEIPGDIQIKCPKPTEIVVSGIDKQRVGQVSADIRRFRPPEPYKGKGIRYEGEIIVQKEGKKK